MLVLSATPRFAHHHPGHSLPEEKMNFNYIEGLCRMGVANNMVPATKSRREKKKKKKRLSQEQGHPFEYSSGLAAVRSAYKAHAPPSLS